VVERMFIIQGIGFEIYYQVDNVLIILLFA